jgi:hypothetical protein
MFLIVGALLLTNKENKPQIALNIKPVEGSSSKDKMTKSIGQATPVLKEPLHSHKAVISAIPDEKITEQTYGYSDPSQTNLAPADLAKREAIKLREIQIKDHAARRKADVTASEAALSDKAANVDSVLQGKAAGVALAKNGAPGVASDIRIRGLSSLPSQKVITGKVIDKNDGQPIPGAMVKIPGTRTGTQTDAKGNFVLHVDTINTKLQIAFIGYKSKQIDIDNKEGPLDISLEASNSSLNEVVVVGYGVKDKDDTAPVYAHPEDGWRSFDKYLKANAISPDGQGGKVKLSFMVDVNGDISDITIIKGLSDASNKKAISIIEDGPSWKGNSNGKPEKVTIKIKFEK